MLTWLEEYGINFPREDFIEVFDEVIPTLMDVFDELSYNRSLVLNRFLIFENESEWFLIHTPTGLIISWYKNLGRANAINREISKSYLKVLLMQLREDISKII